MDQADIGQCSGHQKGISFPQNANLKTQWKCYLRKNSFSSIRKLSFTLDPNQFPFVFSRYQHIFMKTEKHEWPKIALQDNLRSICRIIKSHLCTRGWRKWMDSEAHHTPLGEVCLVCLRRPHPSWAVPPANSRIYIILFIFQTIFHFMELSSGINIPEMWLRCSRAPTHAQCASHRCGEADPEVAC